MAELSLLLTAWLSVINMLTNANLRKTHRGLTPGEGSPFAMGWSPYRHESDTSIIKKASDVTRNLVSASHSKLRYTVRRAIAFFFIAGTTLCFSALAAATSFNCAKAKTNIEKLICADTELGELDTALAKLFSKTITSSGDPDEIAAAEREWLKTVRNKCSTSDCLKSAYHARIKQLARNFVSFDCDQAKTKTEVLICDNDDLQYSDMQLAQEYRALENSLGPQKKLLADQKLWLEKVRDKCDDKNCLLSTINDRIAVLQQQRKDLIKSTGEKIGYTKHAFYSDMEIWPNDTHRTIVMFATQASATQDTDEGPKQDENFDIDLYVIDSTTHKILQHGSDTISSDAIALVYLGLSRIDYAAPLGAPVFGIGINHEHIGCAGYSGESIRLYEASGRNIKEILPEVTTYSSAGMCQTDCDVRSTRRDLQFTHHNTQRYPDILIHESNKVIEDDPKGSKGTCKTTYSKREYKLHFNGVQYPVPDGLGF